MRLIQKLRRARKKVKIIHIVLKNKTFCKRSIKPFETSIHSDDVREGANFQLNANCNQCIHLHAKYLEYCEFVAMVGHGSTRDWNQEESLNDN